MIENIKILEKQKRNLIYQFNGLLYEFNEYKNLISKSVSFQDAEITHYSNSFYNSGHDIYYESYFCTFEYESLSKKIKRNKEERKELTKKIKEIKYQIKNLHNQHTLKCQ